MALLLCGLAGCSGGGATDDPVGGPAVESWPASCVNTVPNVDSFAVSSAGLSEMWVNSVYTTDAGHTWRHAQPGDTRNGLLRLSDGTPVTDRTTTILAGPGRLYSYTRTTLRRSDDDGATWKDFPLPLTMPNPGTPLVPFAAAGMTVALGWNHQFFLSTDGGAHFGPLPPAPGASGFGMLAVGKKGRVAMALPKPGGPDDTQVYASDDGGATWKGWPVHNTTMARVIAAPDGDLWVVNAFNAPPGAIYYSPDWGTSWTGGVPAAGPYHWAPDAAGSIGRVQALGGGRLAWSSYIESTPTRLNAAVCMVGPGAGDIVPGLLPEKPTSFPRGSLQVFRWLPNRLSAREFAVDDTGAVYLAHRKAEIETPEGVVLTLASTSPTEVVARIGALGYVQKTRTILYAFSTVIAHDDQESIYLNLVGGGRLTPDDILSAPVERLVPLGTMRVPGAVLGVPTAILGSYVMIEGAGLYVVNSRDPGQVASFPYSDAIAQNTHTEEVFWRITPQFTKDGELIYKKHTTAFIARGRIELHADLDPCAAEIETDHCYPMPPFPGDAAGFFLAVDGLNGDLYAASGGTVSRRPIEAQQAPWEAVGTGFWRIQGLQIQEDPAGPRIYIMDRDLWVLVPGDDLPLMRRFPDPE